MDPWFAPTNVIANWEGTDCMTTSAYRKLGWAICAALLALHGMIAFTVIRQHNLTVDEGGHILSGLITWKYGRVDVYPVNPPLAKLIVSLPLTLAKLELPEDLR